MNQSADLFPITKWIVTHELNFGCYRWWHLENELRNVEYQTFAMARKHYPVDWASFHRHMTEPLTTHWKQFGWDTHGRLGNLKEAWVRGTLEAAKQGQLPVDPRWWQLNAIWDPNSIRVTESVNDWKVEMKVKILGGDESWECSYLKSELSDLVHGPEKKADKEEESTQERWTSGSKWLDNILSKDNSSQLKAIMLHEGVASWRDGAWRTKAGHDVTRPPKPWRNLKEWVERVESRKVSQNLSRV